MAHTRHGQALPDVGGFELALVIAAALCLATAVVSFALPGRAPTPPRRPPPRARRRISGVLVRKRGRAWGGAGPAAGRKPLPPGPAGGSAVSMSDATTGHSGRTPGPAGPGTPRPAKDVLLQGGARALFGQRGFEGHDDPGDRRAGPGSTAALHRPATFGSKADLYIAAVMAEGTPEEKPGAVRRAGTDGRRGADPGRPARPGPRSFRAIVRSDTSAEIRAAARDLLEPRLAAPLGRQDDSAGASTGPQLRAEGPRFSALFGIMLGRSLGWFDEIRSVPPRRARRPHRRRALGRDHRGRPRALALLPPEPISAGTPAEHSPRARARLAPAAWLEEALRSRPGTPSSRRTWRGPRAGAAVQEPGHGQPGDLTAYLLHPLTRSVPLICKAATRSRPSTPDRVKFKAHRQDRPPPGR